MKIGAAECGGKPPISGALALTSARRHCFKTPKNDVQTNGYGNRGCRSFISCLSSLSVPTAAHSTSRHPNPANPCGLAARIPGTKKAREARNTCFPSRPESAAERARQGIGEESFCACFARTKRAARHAGTARARGLKWSPLSTKERAAGLPPPARSYAASRSGCGAAGFLRFGFWGAGKATTAPGPVGFGSRSARAAATSAAFSTVLTPPRAV